MKGRTTYGENTTCDFKELVERKQPKSWLKSVSAFANSMGGVLVFGVNEVPSKRRNPILADVFTQFGYMEKRGSGLRKIRNETAKLPGFSTEKQPTFRSQYESFFTEILNNNYGGEAQNGAHDGSVNGSVKMPKLTKRQLDIISVIANAANGVGSVNGSVKRGLTTQEIMSKLKMSERTAYRELATLKRLGLIQRIGSDKTGHWEVLSSQDVPLNVPQDGSVNVAQDVAQDVAQEKQ